MLATPLIVDLVVLTELFTRVRYRDVTHLELFLKNLKFKNLFFFFYFQKGSDPDSKFARFHPVLSILAYLLKAPMVKYYLHLYYF